MGKLARIAGRIRRALALLIVGAIAGAIIGELVARACELIVRDVVDGLQDVAAGRAPSRGSDWYAARRLADEAELVKLTVPPAE
jgi:hypothetical protein